MSGDDARPTTEPTDAQALVEQLEHERARLEAVLRQLPVGVIIGAPPSGRVVLANEQAERIFRQSFDRTDSVADYARYRGFHPDGRPLAPEEWPLARALAAGEDVHGQEIDILRGDDSPATILANAAPVIDRHGTITSAVVTFDDISAQRRTQEHLRFLIEASELLAASLDYTTTLASVVDLLVPRLADWAVVDLVDADGAIRRLAMKHRDPEKALLLADLERQHPHEPEHPTGPAAVIRTRRTESYPTVAPENVQLAARDDEHLRLLRALEMRSYVCVPLVARGRTLGAISLVRSTPNRSYTPEDVALAEELGRRVAVAVDNARLYEAERESRARAEATQRRLAFLADASAILASSLDADALLDRLAHLSVPFFGTVCTVDIRRESGGLRRVAVAHRDRELEREIREVVERHPQLLQANPTYERVLATAEPFVWHAIPPEMWQRVIPEPEVVERLELDRLQSALTIPLIARGEPVGVMSFISEEPHAYDTDDIALACELGNRAAVAIDNARLYREAEQAREENRRTADRLSVLAEASRAFAEPQLDLDTILATVADEVALHIGDLCIIRLLSDDGEYLEPVAVRSTDATEERETRAVLARARHHVSEGLNGQVVRSGEPVLLTATTHTALLPLVKPDYREHLQRFQTRGLLIVPLRSRGRVLGTIGLSRTRPDAPYANDDLVLLQDIAERAALAIESAQLLRDAQIAEARYRSLFESTADAILVADEDGHYHDANPAAVRLLGYEREELLTLSVGDIVAAGPSWATDEYGRYRREGFWHGELTLRRKDGSEVPVEATATVGELPSGPVYLSSIRDISERRAAEQLQRDFIAMVTHDLKSPLTSIRGFAQLMQRRESYSARSTEAIVQQTMHLERLITDLMDAARFGSGRAELRPGRMDLVDLAASVLENAQASTQHHRLRLDARVPSLWGTWDHDRLAQVLQNLIGNAIKYSPEGGEIVVTVALRGEQEARVTIADQGIGIPAEALPRLFGRFYRVEGNGSAQGLGLGLFIARTLVEAHGGTIGVDTRPGAGSTFWFTLPVA